MAKVKFRGFEYEIPGEYTNREMIRIEQVSGLSAFEIDSRLRNNTLTYGAACAIAHIAISRAGAKISLDDLLDANVGELEIIGDEPAPAVAEVTPLPASEEQATA